MNKIKTSLSSSNNLILPIVIVNPKSASGSTKYRWSQITSDLRSYFGPFQVAFTRKQGDGVELTKRFIESGGRFVIACGGDGTINEVANGILESGEDAELGIIPAGTGGDFRRALRLSPKPKETAKQLKEGITRRIDVGKVNLLDHNNNKIARYFLNVASFGLSASISARVKKVGKFQWIPGKTVHGTAKFAISTFQEILNTETRAVHIKVDDKEEKLLNTINFCACNSSFFGGGMKIAPNAKINDGYLNIVNIGSASTMRILLNSYKLYSGSHIKLPEVKTTLAKKIIVYPKDENVDINIETDGELPGKLPATFEIVPKSLKVRVPKIDN